MAEQRGENCAKEEMTSSKGSSPTKEEASSKKVNEQNILLEDGQYPPHVTSNPTDTSSNSASHDQADSNALTSPTTSTALPSEECEPTHITKAQLEQSDTTPSDDNLCTIIPDPESSASVIPSQPLDTPTDPSPDSPAKVDPVNDKEDSEVSGNDRLGPEVNIMLEDRFDRRIPYNSVVPISDNQGQGSHFQPQDENDQETLTLDKTTAPPSHMTGTPLHLEGVESESKDILGELPAPQTTSSPNFFKGKRLRSETESRSSKVSFIPFKGRKRSHTIQEGSVKEDYDKEDGVEEREMEWEQWSDILKNWEEVFPKNNKLVKHMTRQGIPEHLRGMAWQLLSDSINLELKEKYPTLINESSPHERAIRRDLNRTFPEHSFFMARDGLGQESLCNVLKAYSVYDKEVGYCQGAPFVAGLLLMQMPEEEAFCVLVKLMTDYRLRDLYKPTMADLSLCFYQLDKLIEEAFPVLSMHFKAVGFQTSMYASPWFLTLFASVLTLNAAFRVMDLILVEGREVIFKIGLALLEYSQDKLLQMDVEDMIKHFQKDMRTIHEEDPERLISTALRIKLSSKKMKKLSKEYQEKKARKTLEITEMARLQNEVMEVNQKLSTIQQERDSLREQLIQGQMARAEEAQEMLQLRNKLAVMSKRLVGLEQQALLKNETHSGSHANVPEWAETNDRVFHDLRQEPHFVKLLSVNGSTKESSSSPPSTPPTSHSTHQAPSLAQEVGNRHDHTSSKSEAADIYSDSPASTHGSPVLTGGQGVKYSSRENLNVEEETSESSPTPLRYDNLIGKEEKKKKKKLMSLKRSKSNKKQTSAEGDLDSPLLSGGGKEEKKEERWSPTEHELGKELALAKTNCAEYANLLELKILEHKQALQRESFLLRELKEVREYVSELESKASNTRSELCPSCRQTETNTVRSPDEPQTPPTLTSSTQDTGSNSSQDILQKSSSSHSPKKDLT